MTRQLPSESNNPDRGWWRSIDSSDLFGHFSPLSFEEKFCPECGGVVEVEPNAEIAASGRLGAIRTLYRCPDCGKAHRRGEVEAVEFVFPGMEDPDEISVSEEIPA